MVINENLVDLSQMTYTMASYDKDTKIAKVVDSYHASRLQIALPEGYKTGDTYTFSCNIDNIDGDDTMEIVTYPGTNEIKTLKSDGTKQTFKFTVADHKTNLYLYLGIRANTKGSYKIYNIKIEKGDKATPYIPSKNSLDPSKQAIFKVGGYSKRCIHSHRIGGGVC